jgi:phosphoglycolate phosphatase
MSFKGIIFDLDGTLLDSLTGIAAAMDRLLKRLGYPTHSLESYKYFVGEGIGELIRRALPEARQREFQTEKESAAALEPLVVEYRRIYDETWPRTSPPYPDIPRLLEDLAKKGIKMGVLSNKSEEFTRRMVVELLPQCYFDAVFGARPGVPLKPHPAVPLEIARIMGTNPENMLFVGDSGVDMRTAVNADMYPVGALWGFRDARELLENGAKRLIKQPLDLIKIIREEEKRI